jgi:hypothetical protein
MITAKIQQILFQQNRFIVFVEFSNGEIENMWFETDVTGDHILQTIQQKVIWHNEQEAKAKKLEEDLSDLVIE